MDETYTYDSFLSLPVTGWFQTIGHGDIHAPYLFSITARTSDTEDLVFGAEGWQWMRNMPVHLNITKGKPDKPPERGIGRLVYHPEMPPNDDFDGTDQGIGGWFWLPEDAHAELWKQAREHRYDDCVLELHFGPVEPAGGTRRWNTEKNKAIWITSAAVRFERKLKPPADPDASPPEPPKKKRGLFSLGRGKTVRLQ